ncbi:hypothetical protein Clacol_010547 [Clathrus columnatus]|uniref:Uncharacterized protein n=1 Tax=Clathrus columnatus TaxID=1419009 RepID=A0AAV5AVA7_9AGAM|nr:hypothetical protein Clacol_010547 [Clathrus columnatus]
MFSPPHSPPPQAEFPEDVAQYTNAQFEEHFNDQATHIGTNTTLVGQENVWDLQEIFYEISQIAMTSYDAIRAARDHPQDIDIPQEEHIIPDGAVFPIDIPVIQPPIIVEPPESDPMLYLAEPANEHAHVGPFGGQTLVTFTTSAMYDDNEIPHEDPSWSIRPETHPWFVEKYGREAHQFCAKNGLAPKLLGVESLPGGWLMIVMERLDNSWTCLFDVKMKELLTEEEKGI